MTLILILHLWLQRCTILVIITKKAFNLVYVLLILEELFQWFNSYTRYAANVPRLLPYAGRLWILIGNSFFPFLREIVECPETKLETKRNEVCMFAFLVELWKMWWRKRTTNNGGQAWGRNSSFSKFGNITQPNHYFPLQQNLKILTEILLSEYFCYVLKQTNYSCFSWSTHSISKLTKMIKNLWWWVVKRSYV